MKNTNQHQFEILAISIFAVLKFILIDWLDWRAFYLIGAFLFWLSYIFFQAKTNNKLLRQWGFHRDFFKQAFLYLVPFILVTAIASMLYSTSTIRLIFSMHFLSALLLYPFWGMLQQFLMLGIISRALESIIKSKNNKLLITFLVSILFSLIHYPSLFLMAFAFFMEAIFILTYFKWRNLWAIGIAHGWIGTFLLFYVLDRDIWLELAIRF